MSEYTQGVCRDGAAILKDGQPLTIEQILEALRERDALAAHVQRLINTGNATDMCAFGETKEALEWDKACNDTPPISLARRDAKQRAQALSSTAEALTNKYQALDTLTANEAYQFIADRARQEMHTDAIKALKELEQAQ